MRTNTVTVSTAPSSLPVFVSDAKKHLEIAESDKSHDTHICGLIEAAMECVENDARISLVTQTLTQTEDAFPSSDYIELRRGPASSVTSIQYVDTGGATQTFSSSKYTLDANRLNGVIFLVYNESWPGTRGDRNAVTVTYVAGTSAVNVPKIAQQAVLLQVGNMFENREPILVGSNSKELEMSYKSLIHRLQTGDYP